MRNVFSKVLVTMLMVIAFVGQTLAYSAMSCEMSTGTHQSHQVTDNAMMDHSMHSNHQSMNHMSMNHEGMEHAQMSVQASEDCCEVNCQCPANACMSTTMLHSSVVFSTTQALSDDIITSMVDQPKSISTSLYRPPIFA